MTLMHPFSKCGFPKKLSPLQDEKWIANIHENINDSMKAIEATKDDISRVIGENNLQLLRSYLDEYSKS